MLQHDHASLPRSEASLGKSPRYALVYTTARWDPFIESMYRRNAGHVVSGALHVVTDESAGPVDIPLTFTKCIATQEAAAALGLRITFKNALFQDNGDYLAYLFFFRHPTYDYYVFLDDDAYVNTSVDQLVADIARRRVDYVGTPAAGGFSGVTVLSKAALAYLFMRRRQMSASSAFGRQTLWPQGMAFVASELQLGGFVVAPLCDFGDVGSFAWWPPELDETYSARLGRVRQMVSDRPHFMQSMLRRSTTRDPVRPNAQLWRAIRSCEGWRWALPLASEAARRLAHLARVGQSGERMRSRAQSPLRPATGLRIPHAGRVTMPCNRNGRYGIGKATRG